eukprot:SAG22_NODE_4501_length_1249_cov_3.079130_1_plen_252_part_01
MAAPPAPVAHAAEPTTEIELSISCNGLPNMDTFSKSDPMVVVYKQDSRGRWHEIGKTETVWDNLDPHFTTSFQMQYFFERSQLLRFEVYDIDDEKGRNRLDGQDFIGEAEVQLAAIVTARGGHRVPLAGRRPRWEKPRAPRSGRQQQQRGTITLTAEETGGANDEVHFAVQGMGLAALNFFGKSDPILVLHRAGADGTWVKVFESEAVKANCNPSWRPFAVSTKKLCNNEGGRPILVEVLDWEASGDHRPIG